MWTMWISGFRRSSFVVSHEVITGEEQRLPTLELRQRFIPDGATCEGLEIYMLTWL